MTAKQTYLRALSTLTDRELAGSAANPSPHMRPVHITLHRLEMRRRARIASYWAGIATSEGWD